MSHPRSCVAYFSAAIVYRFNHRDSAFYTANLAGCISQNITRAYLRGRYRCALNRFPEQRRGSFVYWAHRGRLSWRYRGWIYINGSGLSSFRSRSFRPSASLSRSSSPRSRVVAAACLSTHRHPALIKDNSCNGVISDDRGVLEAELLISIWKSASLSPASLRVRSSRVRVSLSRTSSKIGCEGCPSERGWLDEASEGRERTEYPHSRWTQCAARARKGVANRSENTEPEIAAQPARRVPALEPIERSSPISEFQIRACRVCVAGISHWLRPGLWKYLSRVYARRLDSTLVVSSCLTSSLRRVCSLNCVYCVYPPHLYSRSEISRSPRIEDIWKSRNYTSRNRETVRD